MEQANIQAQVLQMAAEQPDRKWNGKGTNYTYIHEYLPCFVEKKMKLNTSPLSFHPQSGGQFNVTWDMYLKEVSAPNRQHPRYLAWGTGIRANPGLLVVRTLSGGKR